MNIKVSFHNMPHSEAIEVFVREKLDKINTLFKDNQNLSPFTMEMFLNANKKTIKMACELHMKTPDLDLVTQDGDPDMYIAITKTIEKMISLVKKEKEKIQDKHTNIETEKRKFYK